MAGTVKRVSDVARLVARAVQHGDEDAAYANAVLVAKMAREASRRREEEKRAQRYSVYGRR